MPTWREPHRDEEFPFSEALKAWAEATVPILEEVAGTYGGYITYSELASRVFDETGIRTTALLTRWSGRLLNGVIHLCLARGLPALSSLVVYAANGTVGPGFDEVLRASGRDVPGTELERERAAAAERLECYRAYCLDVPADAEPQLTLKYAARVNPMKKDTTRPKPVCAVHGIQLPATGVCDDCA